MKKILIADDHPIVRAGLKQIINDEINLTVSGEASNGVEVKRETDKNEFDLVILDISMPGDNGIDILKQLKYTNPKIKVLILSTYPEDAYAERAFKAGASGYLNKQYATRDLILAINKIINGGKFISQAAAENIAFGMISNSADSLHKKLSDREFQVLTLLGSGNTISEIGEELLLSVKTISTYRKRILEKMELKNTAALIKYAVEYNIVE